MKWSPIRSEVDFISQIELGRTRESLLLEFKQTYDARNPNAGDEVRKDVAALANAFGGVIVVGVGEQSSIAASLQTVDVERTRDWIRATLATRIFPSPTVDLNPIQVADPISGRTVELLAINVHPSVEHAVFIQDERRSEWIGCPIRDDIGVKFLSANEVAMRLDSRARRIYLTAIELQAENQPVHITSHVVKRRRETLHEIEGRLDPSAGGRSLLRAATSRPNMIEEEFADPPATFGKLSVQMIEVIVDQALFTIPWGSIRELWKFSDGKLAVAFDCELVFVREKNNSQTYVRFV